MLFKLLKLFGLDVKAEIAAVKGEITRRVDDAADRARHLAVGAGIIAALAAFAGLLFVTAIGVGLFALYRFLEAAYGADVALGILAAVLIGGMLILLGIATMVARSLKSARPAAAVGADVAGATAWVAPPPQPPPEAMAAAPLMSSGDLVEPLTLVLGLFAKDPKLGHPALDEFVTGLPNGGKPDEAVAQALDVIRNGDRIQLAIILGAAVAAGWLLARGRPQPGSTPGGTLQ
jgi:hypothetical protein